MTNTDRSHPKTGPEEATSGELSNTEDSQTNEDVTEGIDSAEPAENVVDTPDEAAESETGLNSAPENGAEPDAGPAPNAAADSVDDAGQDAQPETDTAASDKEDEPEDAVPDAPEIEAEPADPAPESPDVAEAPKAPEPPSAPVETIVKETVVERKGGFLPMLLGGVVAAGVGFGVAQYPDGWPFASTAPDPFRDTVSDRLASQDSRAASLETALDDTAARLAQLEATVTTGLETAGAQVAGMESRRTAVTDQLAGSIETVAAQGRATTSQIDALSAQITALSGRVEDALDGQARLSDRIAEVQTRLVALEKRPVEETVSPEAIAAYEREIDRLREEVVAQRNEVAQMAQNAVQAEQAAGVLADTARARAALAEVFSALDNGSPFDTLLPRLAATGVVVPAGLTSAATDGIPTQGELVDSFPQAARAALSADRASAASGGDSGGLTGLLQRQLGLRSLAPKEGDDTDAVLSRAEAALRSANLEAALAELDLLAGPAADEMSELRTMISARRAALDAAASVAAELN